MMESMKGDTCSNDTYSTAVRRKVRVQHRVSVSGESFWLEPLHGIKCKQSRSHVTRGRDEALRVRRPLDAQHLLMVASIRPM